ncbi:MAG TPA: VOC family protein [Xanthobacteraceae bacterium]|jgi:2,3-dihydroxybiphenyl 1,2-dioxygenase|nr:VOC family protein [Xanthobacteraceae bacterium]
MNLSALGYVGISTNKLDDWADYGTRFLGMQLVDKSRGTLALRMDDRMQRVLVHRDESEGPSFYGWEVADGAALDALAAHLEKSNVKVARGSPALADERRVKDLIVFSDPVGNRLEAFHGAEVAADPFKPGRAISGFRTGPLGMGHAVLTAERIDDVIPFYTQVLNFKLTDYFEYPFRAYFFHINTRHHSLAFIETGKNGIHHMMFEVCYLDDVGQAYDLALRKPEMIGTTFGRHVNDHMTSFYSYSPSQFLVEYGWGGRCVDPATWTPHQRTEGPSLWGHDRMWLSPEAREESHLLRMKIAAEGVRVPVNVMDGNYLRAADVCPWWNANAPTRKTG